MRVPLKSLNSCRRKLADGQIKTYYYAGKGAPRLRGNPGDSEFIASYYEAVASKVVPRTHTLHSILYRYQQATEFTDLAERTRRDYV